MPSDRTAQGIVVILASVFAMAFADAIVKLVSTEMTVWQVFVTRSVFALPCLAAVAYISGARTRLKYPKWAVARSGLLILAWLSFYAALPLLDLAVAAAAIYTNPILTALLSAALLKERVSARQWIGVALGFLGVAAILQPGSDAFSWPVTLPLLGAAFYSAAMVLTRSRCFSEGAVGLALALHTAFILSGIGATAILAIVSLEPETQAMNRFLLGGWFFMGPYDWAIMGFLGALFAAYSVGVARAYQIAPPQIIATFDYGYLVSATIWGVVIFAERPGPLTLTGMGLIILAGVLVAKTTPSA